MQWDGARLCIAALHWWLRCIKFVNADFACALWPALSWLPSARPLPNSGSFAVRLPLRVQAARGVKLDVELTADDLKELVERYKGVYKKNGQELPQDPYKQMEMSICAVFRSWNAPRAGEPAPGWGGRAGVLPGRGWCGRHARLGRAGCWLLPPCLALPLWD